MSTGVKAGMKSPTSPLKMGKQGECKQHLVLSWLGWRGAPGHPVGRVQTMISVVVCLLRLLACSVSIIILIIQGCYIH